MKRKYRDVHEIKITDRIIHLKLLNTGRLDPFFIGAVKIRIEADEHQLKFFRNNILVGIIEIEPERCSHLFNPHDILTTQ